MILCKKCAMMVAALTLLVGLAFLCVDLGFWAFWNINWWTAALGILGFALLLQANCKACQDLLKK
ncbi:MAG: hypothetical protein ABIJ18_02340 [archaeon]